MDLQRKAEETKFKADQENMRAAQRLEYEYDKLAQQDEQSDERLEVAREKIQSKMRKGLSGGVRSGPPPKRGPNPQGIKLKHAKKLLRKAVRKK
jgi:hypothetical protein